MQKLFSELKRFFLNPVEAVTSSIETCGEWSASRQWMRILPMLPFALLVLGIYIFAAVRDSAGEQQRLRAYFEKVDAEYSLSNLETLLYRDVIKLNLPGLTVPEEDNFVADANDRNATDAAADRAAIEALESPTEEQRKLIRLTLNRLEQIAPENNENRYRLAVIDALEGNLDAANQTIAKLSQQSGIPLLAANHWHAINLLNQRASGATVLDAEVYRVLERAVEWRSAKPEIRAAFASLLLSQGKVDRALEQLMIAAERQPARLLPIAVLAKNNNRERVFQQAVSKAEKYYRARIDKPSERPLDRIAYAETQLLLDRKALTIEILSSGIENSSIPQPQLKLALSDFYLRQFSELQGEQKDAVNAEAMGMLQKAIETEPLNPQLGRVVAMLMSQNIVKPEDMPRSFTDVLAKQISANKIAPDTLMILGGMYYQQKKFLQAETAWKKAVELRPDLIEALNNLAMLEFELPKPNTELALERIQRAFELAPQSVEICDSYGQILMNVGQHREAIAMFERALRQSPDRPATRELLAKCYAAIGQSDISDAHLRFISKNNPPPASTSASTPVATEGKAAPDSAAQPESDGSSQAPDTDSDSAAQSASGAPVPPSSTSTADGTTDTTAAGPSTGAGN